MTVTPPVNPFELDNTSVPGFGVLVSFRMNPDVPSSQVLSITLPPPIPLTVILGVVPLPAASVSVVPLVITHEPVLLVAVSPNTRLPSAVAVSSVTVCVPVMLSVEKFANAPVPLAMAPPDQLAVLVHVPPDAFVQVPLVCARETIGIIATTTAYTSSILKADKR